jgi:uncharacterized protein (DUF305 family)
MASGHWLHGLALVALTAALPPGAATAACPLLSGQWVDQRFNDQRFNDQRFIVMMIPHHDEAIAMAELALSRARRPEIRALAQQISAAQTAENARMRLWYRQWYGTEVPAQSLAGRGMGLGMGMPGMGMAGMGTGPEALRAASDFDRAFLERMIPHHRMGVMMASHACLVAQHPELRRLQGAMVRLQNQEIERMQSWYSQWYGVAPLR